MIFQEKLGYICMPQLEFIGVRSRIAIIFPYSFFGVKAVVGDKESERTVVEIQRYAC